jgi:hypothetical protein
MERLKRILLAAVMCCIVSAGAFAQKQDPDKPPPKDPNNQTKVKANDDKRSSPDRGNRGGDRKKP